MDRRWYRLHVESHGRSLREDKKNVVCRFPCLVVATKKKVSRGFCKARRIFFRKRRWKEDERARPPPTVETTQLNLRDESST